MIYEINTTDQAIIEGCLMQGEVFVNGLRFRISGNGAAAHTQNRADFNAFLGVPGYVLRDGLGTYLQDSDPKGSDKPAIRVTPEDLARSGFSLDDLKRIAAEGGVKGAVMQAPEVVLPDDAEMAEFRAWKARQAQQQSAPQVNVNPVQPPAAPVSQSPVLVEEVSHDTDQDHDSEVHDGEPKTPAEPEHHVDPSVLPGGENDPALHISTTPPAPPAQDQRRAELEDLSVVALKGLLTERTIPFGPRDNKDALIQALLKSEFQPA